MKILVTGFDAFGDDVVNPASLILDELPAKIRNHEIETRQIPTSANRSRIELENLLNAKSFDAVICIGQAGGRPDVTLERVAINLDEFRIADNDGEVLSGQIICSDGPDAYLSRLPLKAMVAHISAKYQHLYPIQQELLCVIMYSILLITSLLGKVRLV